MEERGLLRSIPVWLRVSSDRAVLYECVENLRTGRFTVFVATSFRIPSDAPPAPDIPTPSFLERLTADASTEPDEEPEWFDTLAKAVEDHRRVFDDEYIASAVPRYKADFGYE